METDSTEVSSPAQQSMAWATIGSYAAIMAVLLYSMDPSEHGHSAGLALKWVCGVPVAVAFLILCVGRVARHWPWWLRLPGLLALACGLFVWMLVFLTCMLCALFVQFYMLQISLDPWVRTHC